jgi:hypothetical protein
LQLGDKNGKRIDESYSRFIKGAVSALLVTTNLNKSLKIASAAAIIFLVSGIFALVYANSHRTTNLDDEKIAASNDFPKLDQMLRRMMQQHMQQFRPNQVPGWFSKFLENAKATQVSGTVVSDFQGMLILNTGNGQERVLLAKGWTLDNEITGRAKLFNSTFSFSGPGQTVTVKVLKSVVVEKDSFDISVMLGYEVINATGTHAYAVLPFNIEPHS